ncbi:MAG TPA: MFS transporter, partial [Opitutaceae bacterium]
GPMPTSALPSATGVRPRPTWRAGALVYTPAGLATLFSWLLWGDFAFQIKERILTVAAPLVLRQLQASDFLVGALIGSLPQALGMIITPVIAVKSDRHRGRRGRRIPFLMVPAPIASLALIGMGYTRELGAWLDTLLASQSPGLITCQLLAFAVCWVVFDIFTVFVNAVFDSLINDVVPSSLIGKFFGLFRAVSLLAGIIFNFWIIGYVENHYQTIFLGLSVIYGGGLVLMCLYVREGPLPPPEASAREARPGFLKSAKTYVKECFANPYYVWVFLALTFGSLAGGPVNTFSIFYAQSLGISMERYGRLLVVTFITSFALSFVLGWLADKFHPLRVGLATLVLYAAVMLWGAWAATNETVFNIVFIAHGVLMGSYLTGTASIRQRLFPREKFAQFWSASNIVVGVGYVVIPPAVGALLDATGHVYRYTFIGGGIIALIGIAAYAAVYRRFTALGGPTAYVPPR